MQPRIITELKDAIREVHGCETLYVNTVHVTKTLSADPNWDGLVKVFELIGHPEAKRCYAWSYRDGKTTRSMTALEIPPTTSPDLAIDVANSEAQDPTSTS
jgi:hypothetical protein